MLKITEMHGESVEQTQHMAPSYYAGTRNNAYRNSALTGEQMCCVQQVRSIAALLKNTYSAL
jgi:hypothetical protein